MFPSSNSEFGHNAPHLGCARWHLVGAPASLPYQDAIFGVGELPASRASACKACTLRLPPFSIAQVISPALNWANARRRRDVQKADLWPAEQNWRTLPRRRLARSGAAHQVQSWASCGWPRHMDVSVPGIISSLPSTVGCLRRATRWFGDQALPISDSAPI